MTEKNSEQDTAEISFPVLKIEGSQAYLIGLLLFTCAEIRNRATGADVSEYTSSFKNLPGNPRLAVNLIMSRSFANATKFEAMDWNEELLNRKAEIRETIGVEIPRRFSNDQCGDFFLGLETARMHRASWFRAYKEYKAAEALKKAEKATSKMAAKEQQAN